MAGKSLHDWTPWIPPAGAVYNENTQKLAALGTTLRMLNAQLHSLRAELKMADLRYAGPLHTHGDHRGPGLTRAISDVVDWISFTRSLVIETPSQVSPTRKMSKRSFGSLGDHIPKMEDFDPEGLRVSNGEGSAADSISEQGEDAGLSERLGSPSYRDGEDSRSRDWSRSFGSASRSFRVI